MAGERYGRLIVTSRAGSKGKSSTWNCLCDCGTEKVISRVQLQTGNTKSCGCYQRESAADRLRTHGLTDTREYHAWCGAKSRVSNSKSPSWGDYGGRGITMYPEWFDSFELFLRDMGKCPKGYTLDRINNNGNYEPGNCRWATNKQQTLNRRKFVNHETLRGFIDQWKSCATSTAHDHTTCEGIWSKEW
jgi:hypothetical protein